MIANYVGNAFMCISSYCTFIPIQLVVLFVHWIVILPLFVTVTINTESTFQISIVGKYFPWWIKTVYLFGSHTLRSCITKRHTTKNCKIMNAWFNGFALLLHVLNNCMFPSLATEHRLTCVIWSNNSSSYNTQRFHF